MPRSNADTSAKPRQRPKPERRRSPIGRRRTDNLPNSVGAMNAEIELGPFRLDDLRKKVYVRGVEKTLSPKLFDLLKIFVNNPGKVISPAELATNLWPVNERSDPEDVKQYVYLLRRAIESDPTKPCWLRNVRGFGYQLIIN